MEKINIPNDCKLFSHVLEETWADYERIYPGFKPNAHSIVIVKRTERNTDTINRCIEDGEMPASSFFTYEVGDKEYDMEEDIVDTFTMEDLIREKINNVNELV